VGSEFSIFRLASRMRDFQSIGVTSLDIVGTCSVIFLFVWKDVAVVGLLSKTKNVVVLDHLQLDQEEGGGERRGGPD
jgi:hypothetical protein